MAAGAVGSALGAGWIEGRHEVLTGVADPTRRTGASPLAADLNAVAPQPVKQVRQALGAAGCRRLSCSRVVAAAYARATRTRLGRTAPEDVDRRVEISEVLACVQADDPAQGGEPRCGRRLRAPAER